MILIGDSMPLDAGRTKQSCDTEINVFFLSILNCHSTHVQVILAHENTCSCGEL